MNNNNSESDGETKFKRVFHSDSATKKILFQRDKYTSYRIKSHGKNNV